MGSEDDSEHVDTDWSGRPIDLRREMEEFRRTKMKVDDDGNFYAQRDDGTWEPLRQSMVMKEIDGRRYTERDGKWYPVDAQGRVGKDPVDLDGDE